MVKWLMRREIASFERQWNYDASYVHDLIETDPRAALMFQRATSLGKYRKDVPADALFAAAITAVRREDCGPCTQLGVSMAERAGADAKVLRAVLTETPAMMPPDVALAWRFTRATLDHDRRSLPKLAIETSLRPRCHAAPGMPNARAQGHKQSVAYPYMRRWFQTETRSRRRPTNALPSNRV